MQHASILSNLRAYGPKNALLTRSPCFPALSTRPAFAYRQLDYAPLFKSPTVVNAWPLLPRPICTANYNYPKEYPQSLQDNYYELTKILLLLLKRNVGPCWAFRILKLRTALLPPHCDNSRPCSSKTLTQDAHQFCTICISDTSIQVIPHSHGKVKYSSRKQFSESICLQVINTNPRKQNTVQQIKMFDQKLWPSSFNEEL